MSKSIPPGGFIEITDADKKVEVLGRFGEFYHLRFLANLWISLRNMDKFPCHLT